LPWSACYTVETEASCDVSRHRPSLPGVTAEKRANHFDA
jgi:hypothetical protein